MYMMRMYYSIVHHIHRSDMHIHVYAMWVSTYFEFLILFRARRAAQPVCLLAIQEPAHALIQITRKHWQVFSLLLSSTLVSAFQWTRGRWRWWLAWDSAVAGQLHPSRCRHGQLSAHQQPQPQAATQCALLTGV
jgi:hypothetical protein